MPQVYKIPQSGRSESLVPMFGECREDVGAKSSIYFQLSRQYGGLGLSQRVHRGVPSRREFIFSGPFVQNHVSSLIDTVWHVWSGFFVVFQVDLLVCSNKFLNTHQILCEGTRALRRVEFTRDSMRQLRCISLYPNFGIRHLNLQTEFNAAPYRFVAGMATIAGEGTFILKRDFGDYVREPKAISSGQCICINFSASISPHR